MLYCGYSGVGKSTYCKKVDGIDLDSSVFKKEPNWEVGYIAEACKRHALDGKDVFISAHREVIEMLLKLEIDFVLLMPDGSKEEWLSRLSFRYFQNRTDGNKRAILDCSVNFDKDMAYYNSLTCKKVKIKLKPIQTDLEEKLLYLYR